MDDHPSDRVSGDWLDFVGRPLVETGRTRIFGRGRNPINFVSASDVAGVVDLAVADHGLRGATMRSRDPRISPSTPSSTWSASSPASSGSGSHVPLPVLRLLTSPFDRQTRLAAQIAMAVVMDTRDMTADPTDRVRRFALRARHPLMSVVARRLPVAKGALTHQRV